MFSGVRDVRTGTPVVRLEFIFLKDELVVDPLDLRKVEVGFGYQNGGIRDVRLVQLVFEMATGGQEKGLPLGIEETSHPKLPFARPSLRHNPLRG